MSSICVGSYVFPLLNFLSSSSMSFTDLLNTTYQQPPSSSESSDSPPLHKLPPVPNKFTNFDSIPPDLNDDEWLCQLLLGKEDDGGGVDATGISGGENQSRLQNTVQEPNVSPMEEEEVGVKTTHSYSADTELREFRIEDLEDELDESLCKKKRKRETCNELKGHFEDLVNKLTKKQEDEYKVLLEKQERMYKVLLDKIEQKERDRITIKETWKNLETERMRKEEETRAQDTHRNLGQQEINPPQSTKISLGMASMGFTRNAKHCQDKWDCMTRFFKKAEGSCKTRAENAKTCPYFQELDMFYRKQRLDASYKRWTKHETQALISLKMAWTKNFQCRGKTYLGEWLQRDLLRLQASVFVNGLI
ncbi:hypothetical protein MKW98_005984 [Papaver atlanticum]|uniref:Myb/SANT-like DNA-binding domain-containing protein n=1 Tax=Papaver atlanticum TaxID=357466 RepID=A0AAD4S7X0_9MAGN|nr:hypothetical protein MKW98_005984 [Papaver atlanticum]